VLLFLVRKVTCDCLVLQIVENSIKVYKGTNPEVDSYSVFWDNKKLTETSLVSQLQEKNATDIYVCGLAYDVCVGKLVSMMISCVNIMPCLMC
jgi:nicotinamidase-related amidase